jgi:hypothetical protein
MFKKCTTIFGLLVLAGCGGGTSSEPAVVPVSSNGFAMAGVRVEGGDRFDVQNVRRILSDGNGVLSTDRQDVVYEINGDGQSVNVIVAGMTYTAQSVGGGTYQFIEDDVFVQTKRLFAPVLEAEIVLVFTLIEDRLNTSQFVIGHDTNPTDVAAVSGTADMTGRIIISARNGRDDGFAGGNVALNVNFDTNRISGDFNLANQNFSDSDFVVPDTTFALEETDIQANGFAGDISLTSGDLGGTLSEASYDGRFYGTAAATAGGQISATVTVEGADQPTFIEGAFLATE